MKFYDFQGFSVVFFEIDLFCSDILEKIQRKNRKKQTF